MSKKRRNKVNENQEVNIKEEPKMKKEETVERTEDIQDLTDEELGVNEPEEEVDDNEYEFDKDGNRIKIVYIEVEKPNKVKAFFNRHKKLFTGILIGTLTAGAAAGGAAIAYNVAGKKENGVDEGDVDGDYTMKVTTNDADLIDKLNEDIMNSATTSPTSDGIMEF